jgi:hypothetical protein
MLMDRVVFVVIERGGQHVPVVSCPLPALLWHVVIDERSASSTARHPQEPVNTDGEMAAPVDYY